MLAGLYINEFWGVLLIMAIAVGPVVAMMTLFDWLIRLDDARLEAIRQREAAARRPASPRHARDAASAGTDSYKIKKAPTRPSAKAGTYHYGPQSGWPDASARRPEKAPPKPASANVAHTETVNAKSRSPKRVCNASKAREILLAWYEAAGFSWADDFAGTLEKARGIERCLLHLNQTELAIMACRHGLIDGRRMEKSEVAKYLTISNHTVRMLEKHAVIKIDAFCDMTDTTPRWLSWNSQFHCWGYWQDGDHYPTGIKREDPTPSELKAARRRVDDLLAYYVAAKSSPPPSASDTLIANWLSEQTQADAGSRRHAISASGVVTPCPTGHRAWRDIDAIENSFEANWLLDQLEPEERRVVKLAFGIDTSGEHATEEISQLIGLDLLTTRQIEIAALAKLRRIAATRLADRSV